MLIRLQLGSTSDAKDSTKIASNRSSRLRDGRPLTIGRFAIGSSATGLGSHTQFNSAKDEVIGLNIHSRAFTRRFQAA